MRAYDEFYYHMRFPEDRSHVLDLVTAVPTKDRLKRIINLWNENGIDGIGKKQTLMWGIEREDGGRGVGFTGGHYHRNWALDGSAGSFSTPSSGSPAWKFPKAALRRSR